MKSDSQVQQDVIHELQSSSPAAATQVNVEVHGGVVTLSGTTGSEAQRLAVEVAAQAVDGVQALAVEVAILPEGANLRSDAEITHTVRAVLRWRTLLPLQSITVAVVRGWVTLAGEAERSYQRQAVNDAVRALAGVTGLSDHVAIRRRTPDTAGVSAVLAALKRRPDIDVRDISVAVHDGDVTLSGSVHHWWERELACQLVWSAPGVRQVHDELRLSP